MSLSPLDLDWARFTDDGPANREPVAALLAVDGLHARPDGSSLSCGCSKRTLKNLGKPYIVGKKAFDRRLLPECASKCGSTVQRQVRFSQERFHTPIRCAVVVECLLIVACSPLVAALRGRGDCGCAVPPDKLERAAFFVWPGH